MSFSTLLIVSAAATFVLIAAALASAGCTVTHHNLLKDAAITLCGEENGATPGSAWKKTIPPGQRWTRACVQATKGNSFQTYYSQRNNTLCKWSGSYGTSIYPWVSSEGVSWENGLNYVSLGQNWAGEGPCGSATRGYQGSYSAANVNYKITLLCSSYGKTPYNASCGPSGADAQCAPSIPNQGGCAATGVGACGPAQAQTGAKELHIIMSDV